MEKIKNYCNYALDFLLAVCLSFIVYQYFNPPAIDVLVTCVSPEPYTYPQPMCITSVKKAD